VPLISESIIIWARADLFPEEPVPAQEANDEVILEIEIEEDGSPQ
jgi:hypothetical protein